MSALEPDDYAATLQNLKQRVHSVRLRVQRQANTELLQLWWQIGRTILDRQADQGWGAKVLERLAGDLRAEFPSMTGFSRRNLQYMRAFAEAWPEVSDFVQRPIAQLPWGHVIELLDKLNDQELRDWYAAKDVHHGWSRPMLAHQIAYTVTSAPIYGARGVTAGRQIGVREMRYSAACRANWSRVVLYQQSFSSPITIRQDLNTEGRWTTSTDFNTSVRSGSVTAWGRYLRLGNVNSTACVQTWVSSDFGTLNYHTVGARVCA